MKVSANRLMVPATHVNIPQQLQNVDNVDAIDVPFVVVPDSNSGQAEPEVGQKSVDDRFVPAAINDKVILARNKNAIDENLMLARDAQEYGEDTQLESTLFDKQRYLRNGRFA